MRDRIKLNYADSDTIIFKTKGVKPMDLQRSKAGRLDTSILNTAILAIVLLVVLFQLYAQLVPEAQAAGDQLNASGVPLGALFAGQGIVFVIIMAALIIRVVKIFLSSGK